MNSRYLNKFGIIVIYFIYFINALGPIDIPCQWENSGESFNLQKLTIPPSFPDYSIKDGDIPCTPEIEPTFSYVWNICSIVNNSTLPNVCWKNKKLGAAMQYLVRQEDKKLNITAYEECYVIGKYDALNDDTHYKLLDSSDPTVGISMTYKSGDKCSSKVLRSATIDIYCKNVEKAIISVNEPSFCQYHISMQSYYGCPTACPITENGLCNSHGHCYYDNVNSESYCYCNKGYSGADCSTKTKTTTTTTSTGFSAQLGLMIALLIITLLLIGVIGYMGYRITQDRKAQALLYEKAATSSSHGGIELSAHDFQ